MSTCIRGIPCARRTSAASLHISRSGTFSGNVIDVLTERGLMHQCTDEDGLRRLASEAGTLKVYCGFDPTADSLHLGNLLGILVLSWFQRFGHQPVALVGGATARVGDPSGKSIERPILDEETIAVNLNGIRDNLKQCLNFDSSTPPLVVDNMDWFGKIGLLEFLRDTGKYMRVGSMMSKESVRKRLASEEGISFTEFTYQILQGYDFVHLNKVHNVNVQIGGSDQWGNIIAGTDLHRKLTAQDNSTPISIYGLTFPLITKSDGTKFGKSESGAVWLSPMKLSPYLFYQHIFRTPDTDVINFMRMLTFMELEEVSAYERDILEQPEGYKPNSAQQRLAEEVTRFVHGEAGLALAQRVTRAIRPGSDTPLDLEVLEAVESELPSAVLPRRDVFGQPIVNVMANAGLCSSKSEAKRFISGGGARLNNGRVESDTLVIGEDDILGGKLLLLSTGKKKKMLLRVT